MEQENKGLGASADADRAVAASPSSQQAVSPLRASIPSAGDECEYGCDAYGPYGACSGCTGVIERDDGVLVDQHGDELTGLQIYWLARRLALKDAAKVAWWTVPLPDFEIAQNDLSPFNYGKDCAYARIRELEIRDAQAIEARRAETRSGSVHESAVGAADAPEGDRP